MLRFRIIGRPGSMFNRNIIRSNWNAINESPLKRAGLLVRKIMRNSIRRTSSLKPSPPLTPPRSRAGESRKTKLTGPPFKLIFSIPSRFATNVIIGHVGFGARQTPMEMHEFGQRTKAFRRPTLSPKKRLKARRRKQIADYFKRHPEKARRPQVTPTTVTMPERPFAFPALRKSAARLPALWKNSVSKSTVRNR